MLAPCLSVLLSQAEAEAELLRQLEEELEKMEDGLQSVGTL